MTICGLEGVSRWVDGTLNDSEGIVSLSNIEGLDSVSISVVVRTSLDDRGRNVVIETHVEVLVLYLEVDLES